jgi:hypothetical protein
MRKLEILEKLKSKDYINFAIDRIGESFTEEFVKEFSSEANLFKKEKTTVL